MNRTIKKPEIRRNEIVNAAKKLFLKKDYQAVTMQDLISKLKIAKGTIYHYFNSKEILLNAVIQQIVEEYILKIKKDLAKSNGNAINRMKALIKASNVYIEQEKFLKQLHRSGNISMHSLLLAVTVLKLAPFYAEIIKEGCREGIFKVKCPLESAELLLAGIQFLTDVGCYSWSKDELERRKRALPELFEAQLQAPKGSFKFLLKNMFK